MSDDLIRRSVAIDEIKAWFKIIELNPDILIDNINSIHAVEPKRGEWIITEQDNGHKWTHRKCSECGKGIIEPLGVSRMNFCPNCGADMRKGTGDD